MSPFPSNYTGPGIQVDSFPRRPAPVPVSPYQPPRFGGMGGPFGGMGGGNQFDFTPGVRSLLQQINNQAESLFQLRGSLERYLGAGRRGRGSPMRPMPSSMAPSMAQQLNMLGVGGAGLGRVISGAPGQPNVGLGSLGMGQPMSLPSSGPR